MATSTQSIREIVSTQSSAAAVLERFDIDPCSHAEESLKQACTGLQLSVDQVLEKLADAASNEPGAEPADLWARIFAHWLFVLLGLGAYLLPWICGLFGVAFLFGVLSFFARTGALVFVVDGGVADFRHRRILHPRRAQPRRLRAGKLGASNAGGELGRLTFEYGF